MDFKGKVFYVLPKVIGNDMDFVSPRCQAFGHSHNANRCAARVRKRAGGNNGDFVFSIHKVG
jgi:hypothetical protein